MPSASDFANNIPIPNPGNNVMQNYTEYFTYDQIGNITMHDHYTSGQSPNWSKEYVYNSNNNYLLKHDTTQTLDDYTYDAHGNIITMPHLPSMQWDYKDQLREVELNLSGDIAFYIYDNTGNRVRKVIEKGNIREERYYLGGFETFRKFVSGDLDFERQTLHVDDDKSKVALIETKTIESSNPVSPLEITIRYQYSNHLGTACLELDENADIISYEEYHPFGTTSYRSGRNQVDVSLKRYKYVGKERDEESGLYYYGARYYADWLCRFVSVDPLQFKYPYYTPYQYAGNKPISYIDLDGMEETKPLPLIDISQMINKDNARISQFSQKRVTPAAVLKAKIDEKKQEDKKKQEAVLNSPEVKKAYENFAFNFSNFYASQHANTPTSNTLGNSNTPTISSISGRNTIGGILNFASTTSSSFQLMASQLNKTYIMGSNGDLFLKLKDPRIVNIGNKALTAESVVELKSTGKLISMTDDLNNLNKSSANVAKAINALTSIYLGVCNYTETKSVSSALITTGTNYAINSNPATGILFSWGSSIRESTELKEYMLYQYQQQMTQYYSTDGQKYNAAKNNYEKYASELGIKLHTTNAVLKPTY